MNMFIKNSKGGIERQPADAPRGRGRPRGPTNQGVETREHVYKTAVQLIASRGYDATTLRDIADKADVSVGLLYRYFPSKRAVVLGLYDDLSERYAEQASNMRPGPWRERFRFALRTSLGVLAPRRDTLAALVGVLVGSADDGLFAPATAFSRRRVQSVFLEAVVGASDAPKPKDAAALGRLFYAVHLAIILFWLLDKSPQQKATTALLAMLERMLPAAALAVRLGPALAFVRSADRLCREGLFGEAGEPATAGGAP
jgi:AcrR family transcriptional regulator